jgi:hypothetical protein
MALSSPDENFVSTSLRLPTEVLHLLRRAAVDRATSQNTRVSVSATVAELVLANANTLAGEPKA